MAVNKVIYGGETLVDLTSNTVTASDLAEGVTATAADGTQITGLLPKVEIDSTLSSTSTNPVQNKVINAALEDKANTSDILVTVGDYTTITGKENLVVINPDGEDCYISEVDIVKSYADKAAESASSAKTYNDNITATINTVTTKVDSAVSTAESAQETADSAVSTAESAQETADKAVTYTRQLQRSTAYGVGDIAYSISLPSYLYLECTTAGTTATSEPDWDTVVTLLGGVTLDGTAKFTVRDVRNHHNVGDIVIKDTTPKDSEYLLPMDGQSFDKTVYVLLAELYPSGVLPCLNDNRFLEGAETAGETKSAGLPNITGTVQGVKTWNLPQPSGAFALLSAYNGPNGATSGTGANYSFNASSSSDVYGASTTVQPKSYTVKYYVCYA